MLASSVPPAVASWASTVIEGSPSELHPMILPGIVAVQPPPQQQGLIASNYVHSSGIVFHTPNGSCSAQQYCPLSIALPLVWALLVTV